MNILKRWGRKENINVNKALPSKRVETETHFVEAQILVARARAYAVVYGGQKDGKHRD